MYRDLASYAKRMGHWDGFFVDNNVRLVADWWQGMFTIGSTPDPGALHLTQGVVRVVGEVSFGISTISMHMLTFLSLCLF